MINIRNRNFLMLDDFSQVELKFLLDVAQQLKMAKYTGMEQPQLRQKNIALIFQKDSTRTRCAFEIAAYDQGAQVTYINSLGSHIGIRESIKDTARILGRLYDAIEYRGLSQSVLEELAKYSGIPVWNGLTREHHPTQALGDLLTMREHSIKPWSDLSLCFCGNGNDGVVHSLLIAAAKMGMDFRLATPQACQPNKKILEQAMIFAKQSGARITVTEDLDVAVKKVDFLYTNIWLTLHDDQNHWAERIALLKPYQINQKVLALTENPQVKFMHCLPALHNRDSELGEMLYQRYGLDSAEVTEEVFESAHSIVFDQAENRLHSIKAIMVTTLTQ